MGRIGSGENGAFLILVIEKLKSRLILTPSLQDLSYYIQLDKSQCKHLYIESNALIYRFDL